MNPETTVNRCHYQWHNFLTTSFLENYFGFFTPFSQFPTVLVFHAFCSAIPFNKCKSSNSEWQVLYTTQVTQKAKKYHDGFLQLLTCGSSCKQVSFQISFSMTLANCYLFYDFLLFTTVHNFTC